MKRLALLLGALCTALPVYSAAAAFPAQPSLGQSVPINFALAPGNQQPPKRYFSYSAAPGQSINDTVAVINPGATPLTVQLSTSDAQTNPQGAGVTFSDARQQSAIGHWLRITTTTVTVAPNHVLFVGLTLNIPSSVKPGQYEGTINATNTQAQTVKAGKATFKIHGTIRCIVLLRVTGRASANLRITNVGVSRTGKRTVLGIHLHNTGSVFDQPIDTAITFAGSPPHKPLTVRSNIDTILGGDSTTVVIPIDGAVPPGDYRVAIQVTYLAQLSPLAPAIRLQGTWSGHVTVPSSHGQ